MTTGIQAHFDLNTLLSGHVFAFLMLFSRFGAVMMLFPGIGEPYVPPRVRLMIAFMLSLLLLGPMFPLLPEMPQAPAEMVHLISYEILVGLFFGTFLRLIDSALESAGMIIGMQTGLSNATMINPALATQSPLPSAFLSTIGLVLIFATGLDHFLFHSVVGLYEVFPAGGAFMPGDMAQTIIRLTNNSFIVGIELAAPFLIIGLLLYTALGIMQRLMPTVQLFMIAMPIQIWGGLIMLSLTISGILAVWLGYFDHTVTNFFQGQM